MAHDADAEKAPGCSYKAKQLKNSRRWPVIVAIGYRSVRTHWPQARDEKTSVQRQAVQAEQSRNDAMEQDKAQCQASDGDFGIAQHQPAKRRQISESREALDANAELCGFQAGGHGENSAAEQKNADGDAECRVGTVDMPIRA
ncbi:MAG: hypothetical protein CMN84_06895 [Spongiibacteraceae bacterium]|nr:hypothetical protein [Spongiibacteraceae bacterium]